MATRVSYANGNFTGATTFAAVDTATGALSLIRNNIGTVVGNSSTTSAAFTVTNAAVIDGVLLFVKQFTVGSVGTFKVDLQKGGVSQASVTVNKSDLPQSVTPQTPSNHTGAVFFKFTSNATGDGGSNWTLVLTCTGTAGHGVDYLYTNAGSTTFTKALRTTTPATLAAADDFYVVGELTGAGTRVNRTVTMDSTAATAYGSGVVETGTVVGGGAHIGAYGTLAYGNTGPADPLSANTVLLFGMESGSLVDESAAAHGVIAANNVSATLSDAAFGTRSMWWASTGAYTFYGYHSDWDISNQPFCFEMRIKMTSSGANRFLFLRDNGANSYTWYVDSAGALRLDINSALVCSGGSMTTGVWYAVCAEFDGTTYRLYIDGVMVASSTTLVTAAAGTAWLFIGSSNGGSGQFWGFMDEIRFTKNAYRYGNSGGYALATAAFPRPSQTITNPPASSTNYILRINGSLYNWPNGTLNIGTVGAEVPRNSTAVLEFQQATLDGDFGLRCYAYSVTNLTGLSRTVGKNVVKAKLTGDVSGALNVAVTSQGNTNGSITANAGPDASGTSQFAPSFTDNGTTGAHCTAFNSPSVTNTVQTGVVWLKQGSGTNNRYVRVAMGNTASIASITNGFYSDIDLQAGTAGTVTAVGNGTATSVTISALSGGWLIRMVGKVSSGAATSSLVLAACSAAGTISYAGNTTQNFLYDGAAIVTGVVANDTNFTVDVDHGWLPGDVVCVAGTNRFVAAENEAYPISSASGYQFTSPMYPMGELLNATHSGTAPFQGEVGLLTRNVKIRSTSSTLMTYVWLAPMAQITASWAEFYYHGGATTGKRGIENENDNAPWTMPKVYNYCSLHDSDGCLFLIWTQNIVSSVNVSISNSVLFNAWTNIPLYFGPSTSTGTDWTIDNNLIMRANAAVQGLYLIEVNGTVTNNTICGAASWGINHIRGMPNPPSSPVTPLSFNGNTIHSCGGGLWINAEHWLNCNIDRFTAWRNSTYGIQFDAYYTTDTVFSNLTLIGNANGNILMVGQNADTLTIVGNSVIASDPVFTTTYGIRFQSIFGTLNLNGVDMSGVGTGLTPHSVDLNLDEAQLISMRCNINGCKFSANPYTPTNKGLWTKAAYLSFQRYNQIAGNDFTETRAGTLRADYTNYKTAAPSLRMTPSILNIPTGTQGKLQSGTHLRGAQYAVEAGQRVVPSVWVFKPYDYFGAQPRLIAKANAALGIMQDTVVTQLSSGGALPTMFDPIIAGQNSTIVSNGGLSVSNYGGTGPFQGSNILASEAKSTGKYYFEMTATLIPPTSTGQGYGIRNLVGSLGQMSQTSTNASVLNQTGGTGIHGSSQGIGLSRAIVQGDVIGMAVDITGGKMWWRFAPSGNWNNIGANDPATGNGGANISGLGVPLIPAAVFGNAGSINGNIITANFGGSSFVGAVPSGYTPGWPTSQTGIGTNLWEAMIGTGITAADRGVMEFIVDCDGPSGYLGVDDWAFNTAGVGLIAPTVADIDTFGAPAVPFDLNSRLTGLIGWWDMSNASYYTLSGSTITRAIDRSAAGNNLGNGVITAARPAFSATGFNGLPSAVWTGSESLPNAAFPLGTGGTLMFFAVLSMSAGTGAWSRFFSYVGAGFSQDFDNTASWGFNRDSSNNIWTFARNNGNYPSVAITPGALYRIIGYVDAGAVKGLYLNGVPVTQQGGGGAWTSPGNFQVGGPGWIGASPEWGICTGWDASIVGQLDLYLKNKWNL